MTGFDARDLLRRHRDALNRHDVPALVDLYDPDALIESPMFDAVRGREAIRQSFERLFTVFPDYAVSLSDADFLSDGERAATFGTVTATHSVELFGLPPTGQRIVYHAARLYTLRRGTIARERRLYDFRGVLERLEKTRLDRELVLASAVQNALCRTAHGGAFFDAVSASLPCRAIGGDFVEYLDLPGGQFGLAVGDVAGKGPAAALVAAMLQGMFSIIATERASPSATFARLNRALIMRRIAPRFATLAYGVFAADGRFTYSNAGHHPPLLLTAAGARPLTHGGPILGVFGDAEFPEGAVRLEPGDTIVAYSDGVVEARSPDGSDFGVDRLSALAAAHRADPPDRLLGRLLDAVRDFCGTTPATDDVTLALVRYR